VRRVFNETRKQTKWEEAAPFYSLFNFKWQPTSYGIKYQNLSQHGCKQLINHVQGHEAFTTKDQLYLNLKNFAEKADFNLYDFIPLTCLLDLYADSLSDQWDYFKAIFNVIE
jgi:hypothetical protein